MSTIERLREKALSLPQTPGVYIMKNKDDHVIYIGKAKRLKNRVISYFTDTYHTPKTERMIAQVHNFDTILCQTEIEALTLENVLIKKHTPKYNIRLKDDKSYPYIKVTKEPFPHLYVTRMRENDKAHYFGPYSGMSGAYAALETVMKIFSLASCKRQFPRDIGKERPCIYKEMGRCVAPCAGAVSAEEYTALVRCATEVLDGRVKDTRAMLEERMLAAAEDMRFEEAAKLRDSIRAIDALNEKQKVVSDASVHRDVFSLYTDETECVMALLSVREGALVNKNVFHLSAEAIAEEESIISLVAAYYETATAIPKQVLLDFSVEDDNLTLLSDYLSLCAGRKIEVRIPERGDGRSLCKMAAENAKEAARQHRLDSEREDKNLARFASVLGMPEPPRRIEAYDISNVGNESITASMIVWEAGKLKKSDYRSFHIRTTQGADDYGSMRECLTRRFSHIGDGTPSLSETPDLILLDGGDAHVHVGLEVMASMGLEIPLFGMVKDDFHKTRALTDGERELSIALDHGVYSFIYKLQEEAHRFAVKGTMASKTKTLTHSSLEKIEGIGPAKAKKLLAAMSLSEIRVASEEKLAAVSGISAENARAIAAYYKTKKMGEKKEMMRIITGSAKGKKLVTLEGDATRPTSERIKEAIFSSLQFDIENRAVLDLFAGSGQMGLEALSRGAASAMFIDSATEAIAVCKENAKRTELFDKCRFLVSDYRNFIRKAAGDRKFDLVFIDPPYAMACCAEALRRLVDADLLLKGALVVLESGEEEIDTAALSGFEVQKETQYGKKTALRILLYRGED